MNETLPILLHEEYEGFYEIPLVTFKVAARRY
jgi:hypothetical protein